MGDYRPQLHGAEVLPDGMVALHTILRGLKASPLVTQRMAAIDAIKIGAQLVTIGTASLEADAKKLKEADHA